MFETLSMVDYLSLMLALYLLAAGIGLFFDGANYRQAIEVFRDNTALGYLAAIFAFVAGAVLLRLHNGLGGFQDIVISIVGWGALIEGLLMLAFRRPFIQFFISLDIYSPGMIRFFAGLCFVLGLALLFSVFL